VPHHNFTPGGTPYTPLGELTTLLHTPYLELKGSASAGKEGKEEKKIGNTNKGTEGSRVR